MNYLSLCSGIEAASLAWRPLGWKAVAFSEIEKFPSAVLAHHYPSVPNWGDMTRYQEWPDANVDVLVGGTPCQSFSVAGLRKGLDDPRGNLMLTYGAIAAKYRPTWLVWENVPGVLSSNGGRDFGTFLGMLGQLGYGFAYRVLDAQYAGLAQRRKRVFVVGCLGDWRRAAAVLFERHSLSGHPAPRRETGKTAPTIPSRSTGGGGLGTDFDCDGGLIPELHCVATGQAGADMAPTLNCNHEAPYIAPSLRGEGFDGSEDGTGRGTPLVSVQVAPTLRTGGNSTGGDRPYGTDVDTCDSLVAFAIQAGALRVNPASGPDGVGVQADHAYTLEARAEVQAVCFDTTQITSRANRSNQKPGDACHPLAAGAHAPAIAFPERMSATQCASSEEVAPAMGATNPTAVATRNAVRRLMPVECERLQGFPDGFTLIPLRNKNGKANGKWAKDGPRYKALGNSMAEPCMAWIGSRIVAVAAIAEKAVAA